jgi:Na+-driven multidrug efflux pump
MASMGVMQDQKAVRKRSRALALAAIVVLLLVIGPLAWLAVDYFNSGGHFGDLNCEVTLWAGLLCSALLGAALVAGWLRKR